MVEVTLRQNFVIPNLNVVIQVVIVFVEGFKCEGNSWLNDVMKHATENQATLSKQLKRVI